MCWQNPAMTSEKVVNNERRVFLMLQWQKNIGQHRVKNAACVRTPLKRTTEVQKSPALISQCILRVDRWDLMQRVLHCLKQLRVRAAGSGLQCSWGRNRVGSQAELAKK